MRKLLYISTLIALAGCQHYQNSSRNISSQGVTKNACKVEMTISRTEGSGTVFQEVIGSLKPETTSSEVCEQTQKIYQAGTLEASAYQASGFTTPTECKVEFTIRRQDRLGEFQETVGELKPFKVNTKKDCLAIKNIYQKTHSSLFKEGEVVVYFTEKI